MTLCTGLLVTIDGPSGVGKTTVGGLINERLTAAGLRVLLTTTPSLSPLGTLARRGTHEYFGAALTCLVAADRYQHDRTTVQGALAQGSVVLCDRYVPSSLVFDVLDGVDREHVWCVYRRITTPDIAFILFGDPMLCASRARSRGGYSRFHVNDDAASRREWEMYRHAVDFLRSAGYPVHTHEIGSDTADQVADRLTSAILSVREGLA